MQVDVYLKNIRKTRLLGEAIEKDLQKIQRRVNMFKTDSNIRFELKLEKLGHHDEYTASANLVLPRKKLHVTETASNKVECVNNLTKALIKQLDKFKSQVERHLSRNKKGVAQATVEKLKKSELIEEE